MKLQDPGSWPQVRILFLTVTSHLYSFICVEVTFAPPKICCFRGKSALVAGLYVVLLRRFFLGFVPATAYNVAYTPVAKSWLCKQRSLLGNARIMHATIELFSMQSVPRCYNRELWSLVSSPLAIFQGAHRSAIYIWRSKFRMYMTT
jgi:hypothetical protein